jgi:hypothetical protein
MIFSPGVSVANKTPLEKTSAWWHCTGGFKSRRLKVKEQ